MSFQPPGADAPLGLRKCINKKTLKNKGSSPLQNKKKKSSAAGSKQLPKASGAVVINNSQKKKGTFMPNFTIPRMTECAAKYFVAAADPWNSYGDGACVPAGNSRESHKVRAFSRVTVTIGTAGFGFVACVPTGANDCPALFFSNAAFTGTAATYLSVAAGVASLVTGVSTAGINTPYATSTLVPSQPVLGANQFMTNATRIVAIGLSAQYTGTVMNMGGLMYCLVDSNHSSLYNATTTSLGQYPETVIERVSDKKCWIADFGRTDPEHNFTSLASLAPTETAGNIYTMTNFVYPYSQGAQCVAANSGPSAIPGVNAAVGAGSAAPTAVILFTGVAGNTYEVELVEHLEYIGFNTGAAATPSHRDPDGFALVQESLFRAPLRKQAHPEETWTEACLNALRNAAREIGPMAIRGGAMVLKSLFI